jgi:hypothetical protein
MRLLDPTRKGSLASLSLLLCIAGIGCADVGLAPELDGAGGPIAKDQAAVTHLPIFTWTQGNPDTRMVPGSTHICALSLVQGNFRGGGERVRVYIKSDGWWYIGGASKQNGVAGAAWCAPMADFIGPNHGGGSEPWRDHSVEYSNYAGDPPLLPTGGCPFRAATRAWGGDSATWLTRISGTFDGGAEYVKAEQISSLVGNSTIWASGDCYKQMTAGGYSFFVGNLDSPKLAKFRGPNGVGTAAVAGEYLGTSAGVNMASITEAFCYLTRAGGSLKSSNDRVFLHRTPTNWNLSVRGGAQASARCFLYDQR